MSNELRRPHEDCYLVPGYPIVAGPYPFDRDEAKGRRELQVVLDAGITCFVDLTEPRDRMRSYLPALADGNGVPRARHIPLGFRDNGVPTVEQMKKILDALDEAYRAGERVYVHCWGGVGRTGTVVGCFLVRQGLTGEEALAEVARLFRTTSKEKQLRHDGSPETDAQREFVRRWGEPSTG